MHFISLHVLRISFVLQQMSCKKKIKNSTKQRKIKEKAEGTERNVMKAARKIQHKLFAVTMSIFFAVKGLFPFLGWCFVVFYSSLNEWSCNMNVIGNEKFVVHIFSISIFSFQRESGAQTLKKIKENKTKTYVHINIKMKNPHLPSLSCISKQRHYNYHQPLHHRHLWCKTCQTCTLYILLHKTIFFFKVCITVVVVTGCLT